MLAFKLSIRNILRNRRRSLLTVISLGGGYALLSFMLSMTDGSYNNIIDLFTRDHTGHVQLHRGNYLERPSLYKTIDDADILIERLQAMPEVVSVAPRIYTPSLAYGDNKTFPANVIGIDPGLERATTLLGEKIAQGVYLSEGMTAQGYFPVMLGYTLARNLHLGIGDELVLISQGFDGSIANDIFEVVAIVGTADSWERQHVYLGLDAMGQFLSMGGQVHELAISLQNQKQAAGVAHDLNRQLAVDDLYASPWQEVEAAFYKGMQADKVGNYIFLGVLMFIVSIGVLNTILMATLERTREFGVLRALGTHPGAVFRLIMLESLLLSLFSCAIGFAVALPANYWLSQNGISLPTPIDMGGVSYDTMRGEINVSVMLIPAVVVVCSTLVVSLLPALRAARISPLQALQAA